MLGLRMSQALTLLVVIAMYITSTIISLLVALISSFVHQVWAVMKRCLLMGR